MVGHKFFNNVLYVIGQKDLGELYYQMVDFDSYVSQYKQQPDKKPNIISNCQFKLDGVVYYDEEKGIIVKAKMIGNSQVSIHLKQYYI